MFKLTVSCAGLQICSVHYPLSCPLSSGTNENNTIQIFCKSCSGYKTSLLYGFTALHSIFATFDGHRFTNLVKKHEEQRGSHVTLQILSHGTHGVLLQVKSFLFLTWSTHVSIMGYSVLMLFHLKRDFFCSILGPCLAIGLR